LGYFNDNISKDKLKLIDKNENEKYASILLKPGIYFYKYLVDGREVIELSEKIQVKNGKNIFK